MKTTRSIFSAAVVASVLLSRSAMAEPAEASSATTQPAAEIRLTETIQLPECHSLGWVRANTQTKEQRLWDGVLDEVKWGTPSKQQVVERNWNWELSDDQWREAVKQKGDGKREVVKFDLWLPGDVETVKGIVIMSGHGSGEGLFRRTDLRALARELHLALFKFNGNPMQRGFWPRSLLYERLKVFAQKTGHPELEFAPLFLYGHSNGTGFSAIFPATEGARVWAWVSMRPGVTFQVYQPGAAQVPGLVIFGEDDQFFARPSREENLAVVPALRKKTNALWNIAVEPKTGHGPGENTWPLVFSFLRHTFHARVPAEADARKGLFKLNPLSADSGCLGQNWDVAKGGYQALPIAPYAGFAGDKATASWLINAAYAADWQAFQREGQVGGSQATSAPFPDEKSNFRSHDRHASPAGKEASHSVEGIKLSADSFTLTFGADGRPDTCRRKVDGAELLRTANGGGFWLRGPDTTPVLLTALSLQPEGLLQARSKDGAKEVVFRVTRGHRHISLRLERVMGLPPESLEGLYFQMNADSRMRVLDLDYMTRCENQADGVRVEWRDLWHRSPQDPLGGFAIYERTGDDDEDAMLLRLWVEEKLPHPKVAGEWTVARARQWIERWQHRFAERDQLILASGSIAELHEGVEFARRAGIKQIYLFTDIWRTDPFFPKTDLNWAVNRAVFPRGETDLREFSEFVRNQGMYLALHYVSGGIGLRDPVYVGQKPDRRFASWGAGRLARAASNTDTTLVFQPAPGVVPPAQNRPAYKRPFEPNMLRVGNELIRIGEIQVESDGTWTLKHCQRAQGSTKAVAQPRGEEAAGLLLAYGQNFIPDNDSTLLDEVAQNYAGLLNRCVVEHVEFDGREIHFQEGEWGYRKFATRIYEALGHPTTSHDSSGRQPACWFEYRLNSTRRLMRGSCSYSHGNYSVPVALATPSRPATTLLDAHFTLAQGNLGGALGISKPEPMFGVTPQMLKAHGLTDQFLDALVTWKKVAALLTDEQRARIDATFSRPKGERAKFNRHLCSPVVPVARQVGDHYEVVPTRVLTRRSGDILWQHGQEHGAISPRQFIRTGETLTLENPDAQQPVQFILHVLPAFDSNATATAAANAKSAPVEKSSTDLFTDGNRGDAPAMHGASNVLLPPASAGAIHADGPTRASLEDGALVLTASNATDRMQRETGALPWWSAEVDMTQRRGIGLWVTGDGSGALLLVELNRRDYVVPIDFTGRRYIEIPNGEVAWASGHWGWRQGTKSTDYSKVRRVGIGFGELPPGVQASVKVEGLAALGEIPVALQNPVVRVGTGQIRVRGVVPSGHYLRYSGGKHAIVYDENWNQRAKLPIEPSDCQIPTGTVEVRVSVEQPSPSPWLDVQFLTTGDPIPVGVEGKRK